MSYFEPDEWMEGPNNKKTILKAIAKLKVDLTRIEDCKSIDRYVRGPKDIIHERVDGLIQHIENIYGEHEHGFKSTMDKHDEFMGWEVNE